MFRPSDIVIDGFVKRLSDDYGEAFGAGPPEHRDTLLQVSRVALARVARSDALYHDLVYTLLVTLVGRDILRGRIARDADVSSNDWVHFLASLPSSNVGVVRGTCPGDDGNRCVTGENAEPVELPRGATDGALWPYRAKRSQIFVRHHFRDHAILNWEALAANIEYSHFPPPLDRNHEIASYPGLLRAAHLIATVAYPNFALKINRLFLQARESGIADQLGYATAAEFIARYPIFFWRVLHPLIGEATDLLGYTGARRVWLANMYAHLLVEEHR